MIHELSPVSTFEDRNYLTDFESIRHNTSRKGDVRFQKGDEPISQYIDVLITLMLIQSTPLLLPLLREDTQVYDFVCIKLDSFINEGQNTLTNFH